MCCDFFGNFFHVTEDSPVPNEFSPSRSNIRGTIAMAKLGGDPNSATSEWFFNLADNSASLDFDPNNPNDPTANGGFTVFGRVIGSGMDVVDSIAALTVMNFGSPFGALPVVSFDPSVGLQESDLVYVDRIPNVRSAVTPIGFLVPYSTDPDLIISDASAMDINTSQSLILSFPRPANTLVSVDLGILSATVDGLGATAARMITMWDGLFTRPTHYYAYGPTQATPTPHWYDFSFDPATNTGAVITPTNIELHIVDGGRGDDDLQENGSITHTGAPVTITSTTTTSDNSSCSLSRTPAGISRAGDWGVVALFLAVLAGIRARRAMTPQKIKARLH
jgi:cyclophilin family peptidyl-prolyl cis-trans isomerase